MSSEPRYTKFELRGRSFLNPSAINLNAFIECDRPATVAEISKLLGDHGFLGAVKDSEVQEVKAS